MRQPYQIAESLSSFVGQTHVVGRLSVEISAAQRRGTMPGPILIRGEAGLGKTELAKRIAGELHAPLVMKHCPSMAPGQRGQELFWAIAEQKEPFVLFCDEIHALIERELEPSYTAINEGVLIAQGKRIRVPAFTLIGATTRAGRLPTPFKSRLDTDLLLLPYNVHEIEKIMAIHGDELSIPYPRPSIEGGAIGFLASRAWGNPRAGRKLLAAAYRWAVARDLDTLDAGGASAYCELAGIDNNGLTVMDREYLLILASSPKRTAGIETVAAALGLTPADIENDIEPRLLRGDTYGRYIQRTGRGRLLLERGREAIGVPS